MMNINQISRSPSISEILTTESNNNNQSNIVQSAATTTTTTTASLPELPPEILGMIVGYSTLSNQSSSPEEINGNIQQLISLRLVNRMARGEVNSILISPSNQRSQWISQQTDFCYKNIRACLIRYAASPTPAHYWTNKILSMVQHIRVTMDLSQAMERWFYETDEDVGLQDNHLSMLIAQ